MTTLQTQINCYVLFSRTYGQHKPIYFNIDSNPYKIVKYSEGDVEGRDVIITNDNEKSPLLNYILISQLKVSREEQYKWQ